MEKQSILMKVIKPDSSDQADYNYTSVFLAGSIEMGVAEDWQSTVEKRLSNLPLTIYNPRRVSWDSSWEQRESNPQFSYQVNWEMDKLEKADIAFFYFVGGTKSPISLLELGWRGSQGDCIVCCPDDFWRKGNVEIVCSRFNIPLFNDFEKAVASLESALINKINQY